MEKSFATNDVERERNAHLIALFDESKMLNFILFKVKRRMRATKPTKLRNKVRE